MGLRIVRRVRDEYGEHDGSARLSDEINPFTNPRRASGPPADVMGGGFVVDDEADVEEGGLEITHPEEPKMDSSDDDQDDSSALSEVSSEDVA